MVHGLDKFQEHFASHSEKFVVIGGTAYQTAMEIAGEDSRATKDIDIVLYVEVLDDEFITTFWAFVDKAGYKLCQRGDGSRLFYRFSRPSNPEYPKMLELFSRRPNIFDSREGGRYTKLPVGEELTSLSAILLLEEYYELCVNGRVYLNGIGFLSAEYLIPMKMRAWIDLSNREEGDENVHSDDVKKHRNDVVRLTRIIDPGKPIPVKGQVFEDMKIGIEKLATDRTLDLKSLKIKESLGQLTNILNRVYCGSSAIT